MAYLSRACVTCTDPTRRPAGRYSGRDEKGRRFSGRRYVCDNAGCKINREREHARKQLPRCPGRTEGNA